MEFDRYGIIRQIRVREIQMGCSKKIFYFILMIILVLPIITGCEGSDPISVEIVPAHANMLGSIQLSKILNDTDLIETYDRLEKEPGDPKTLEEALDELVEDIGIDLRDISEAVIFGDVSRVEQSEYLGIILKGNFKEKQFVDALEGKGNFEFFTRDYEGYKLYIDEDEDFGLSLLSNTMILLGSIEAVEDALDVRRGKDKQVSGTVLDTYNQLGDVLVKFAFELPEEAREALVKEIDMPGEIPISFESFAEIETLGFYLNKEEEIVSLHVNSSFLSVDSAEDTYNMMTGALLLFKGMSTDPQMKELLSNINLSVADNSLKIIFEITLSEIEQLAEEFRK